MQDSYLRHVQVSTLLEQPSDILLVKQTIGIVWLKFDYENPPLNKGLCWFSVRAPEFDCDVEDDGRPRLGAYLGDEHFVTLGYVDEYSEEINGTTHKHPTFDCSQFQDYRDMDDGDVVTHYAEVISPRPVILNAAAVAHLKESEVRDV